MCISSNAKRVVVVGLLAMMSLLMSVTNAFAATNVTKVSQISFAYVGSGASTRIVLNVQLPEDTKLPATFQFNYPADTPLEWTGEVLGGDTSADPQVSVKKVGGDETVNTYEVTLEKGRTFQAEGTNPAPTETADNNITIATVGYKPATDADSLILGFEIPKTATVQQQDGLQDLGRGNSAEVYGYALTDVKAGKGLSVEVAYQSNAATSTAQGGSSKGTSTILIVLVVVLVLVVIGILIYAASKRAQETNAAKNAKKGSGRSKK